MAIVCTKQNFLSGLAAVERAIGRNATLPILSYVSVIAKAGKVVLSATDLDIGVVSAIPAKVDEEDTITLLFKPLASFVTSLPEDTIQIKKSGKFITVRSGTLQGRFQSGNNDDFPIIPDLSEAEPIRFSTQELLRTLEEVLPASSITDTRPELTGVALIVDGNRLSVVATDTFRLALRTVPYSHHEVFSVIVPQRSVQEIIRLFKRDETLEVRFAEHQMRVSASETALTSRLLEGTYPDFRAILPKPTQKKTRVSRQTLLSRLEAAVPFAGRLNEVRLTFREGGKTLIISAEHPDVGTYEGEVQIKEGAEEGTIVCNIRYFLDGIRSMRDPECVLELNGEAKPLVLRPQDETGEDCYLLMPIRAT